MRETAIIDMEALKLLLKKQFGIGTLFGIGLSVLTVYLIGTKLDKEEAEEEAED